MRIYRRTVIAIAMAVLTGGFWVLDARAEAVARGTVFRPVEIEFEGPVQTPADTPARDIALVARFQHESGYPSHTVHGFWDGDGLGGSEGGVFKIRFCPTIAGTWRLADVYSNHPMLNHQLEGATVEAAPSDHPGFWLVDPRSPGMRWYKRSDGSHPYIFGNTHYSFLSQYEAEGRPSGNDIAADVRANARYFKKLRFALHGDRYPHPEVKPYFDGEGNPTDDGAHSHRPNPAWFRRGEIAVQTAFETDLIADLILAGPDTEDSRSALKAEGNGGDPAPYLKYIAARYGSYPNVWICLCNEYEIKTPRYSDGEIAAFGQMIRGFLPHPTPLSVHSAPKTLWSEGFDRLPPWNDHQIVQKKIRHLAPAADLMQAVWENAEGAPRLKPTVNDELSYQGEGDRHTRDDTIESHLGAFLGGGYASTGEKPGNKLGQYFRGKFDADEHTAAKHLGWLRRIIGERITFWRMEPDLSIFENLHGDFRGMSRDDGGEFVLGTNQAREGMRANLPPGVWTCVQYDVIAMTVRTLLNLEGTVEFRSPESRAVLYHFKQSE